MARVFGGFSLGTLKHQEWWWDMRSRGNSLVSKTGKSGTLTASWPPRMVKVKIMWMPHSLVVGFCMRWEGRCNGAEVRTWRTSSQVLCHVTWEKCATFLCGERSVLGGVSNFLEVQEVAATLREVTVRREWLWTTVGSIRSESNGVLPVWGPGDIQGRETEEQGSGSI